MDEQPIALARVEARDQYRMLHWRAVRRKLWSALTGRCNCLLKLRDVRLNGQGQARSYAGLREVPLTQIRGSEGRSSDFDADFRPLKKHNRERWVNMALAYRQGVSLPPVQLVQVGDSYFVRDGHHRISVARTLGQQEIDAEVVVWRGAASLGEVAATAVAPCAGLETLDTRYSDSGRLRSSPAAYTSPRP